MDYAKLEISVITMINKFPLSLPLKNIYLSY